MRVGLIGSVGSSLLTLQKLVEHSFNVVGVWGYEPCSTINVSGYCSMRRFAEENHLSYHPFIKINSDDIKSQIRNASVDILFVVGVSQLVDEDMIRLPRLGCVGFHPTRLPKGRGRAPMAWLILDKGEGAATFFKIDTKADEGDIFVQEPFPIEEDDDVASIGMKLKEAMVRALDRWLPSLSSVGLKGVPQDREAATFYARRAPLDGCIDWSDTARDIDRLIKASTSPHPGAFSFYGNYKVLIWKSNYYASGYAKGVIGRVVNFNNDNPVVQTVDGYVELVKYDMVDYLDRPVDEHLIIGSRLGYYDQYEIFRLRNEIEMIKQDLALLKDEK
ncbi:formyltransferase family protein [Parabacteroides sp. ZJ-118]|uniref:formyltransferase family protein n=1 Tax=Parabacteroides sp. ZJ-118 TaxID=2709398 RepID=UPI0013EABDD6|nr:formyltransferase family protein [Parabacteroides sp. ZJ-118]